MEGGSRDGNVFTGAPASLNRREIKGGRIRGSDISVPTRPVHQPAPPMSPRNAANGHNNDNNNTARKRRHVMRDSVPDVVDSSPRVSLRARPRPQQPLPHRPIVHRQPDSAYPWAVCFKLGMAVIMSSMLLVVIALVITSPGVFGWIRAQVMRGMDTHTTSMRDTVPEKLIPIWHTPHDTQSSVTTPENTNPHMLWDIFQSLRHHLKQGHGRIPCLCMHHLGQSVQPYRRACAVYNRVYETDEIFFMVNPHPVGRSKENVVKTEETSIACPRIAPKQVRERFEHVFIEWRDEKGVLFVSRFRGSVGVCMQLAMEEFLGNAHCPLT